jgi:signal peptidase I
MDWQEFRENLFEKSSWAFNLSKVVVVLVIIILLTHFFIATIFVVSGGSMEPNFNNGEYLLINRLVHNFKRGDVIGFYYPGQPSEKYIKRVIGLPGEKIKINKNKVIIYNRKNPDGFVLDESFYLASDNFTQWNKTWQVPDDEYFVMGDNRGNSSDSRIWSTLPAKYIVGRAVLVLWPIKDISIINRIGY